MSGAAGLIIQNWRVTGPETGRDEVASVARNEAPPPCHIGAWSFVRDAGGHNVCYIPDTGCASPTVMPCLGPHPGLPKNGSKFAAAAIIEFLNWKVQEKRMSP